MDIVFNHYKLKTNYFPYYPNVGVGVMSIHDNPEEFSSDCYQVLSLSSRKYSHYVLVTPEVLPILDFHKIEYSQITPNSDIRMRGIGYAFSLLHSNIISTLMNEVLGNNFSFGQKVYFQTKLRDIIFRLDNNRSNPKQIPLYIVEDGLRVSFRETKPDIDSVQFSNQTNNIFKHLLTKKED